MAQASRMEESATAHAEETGDDCTVYECFIRKKGRSGGRNDDAAATRTTTTPSKPGICRIRNAVQGTACTKDKCTEGAEVRAAHPHMAEYCTESGLLRTVNCLPCAASQALAHLSASVSKAQRIVAPRVRHWLVGVHAPYTHLD